MSQVNVVFTGGLGNTLFQYAFGRGLEARGREVTFNRSSEAGSNVHDRRPEDMVPQPHLEQIPAMQYVCTYGLDMFKTKITFGPAIGPIVNFGVYYRQDAFDVQGPVTVQGIYYSHKYFNFIPNEIRTELQLKEEPPTEVLALAKRMRETNSVSLHVRRGDYTIYDVKKQHGLMPLSYYNEALQYISAQYPDLSVFTFSDDLEWCRANMPGEVAGTGNRYYDFWLMSQARHSIIGNSSYSWWAAWLGDAREDRIVVRPKQWHVWDTPESQKDMHPEDWVSMGKCRVDIS